MAGVHRLEFLSNAARMCETNFNPETTPVSSGGKKHTKHSFSIGMTIEWTIETMVQYRVQYRLQYRVCLETRKPWFKGFHILGP